MNMNTVYKQAPRGASQRAEQRTATAGDDTLREEADTQQPIRLGLWVLVGGFALFLLWAAWAPLGEGVVAPAKVSIETRRLAIQHQFGGVIRSLAVVEGQQVKRGDVLIELDDATTRAGFESVRQNYLAQRAMESRLLAEMAGAASIQFHQDLTAAPDPVAMQLMAAQEKLFAARRAAVAAERAAAQEQVAGLRGQIEGLEQVLDSRRARRELQATQLEGLRALAAEGYAPRNQVLRLEEEVADLGGAIADNLAQIQRARNAIAEIEMRMAQRQQELLTEASSQLAEVRREVQANEERLVATRAELGRTRITAPTDGQVVGLAVAGVGGVVSPGQRLMDIVPRQVSLLLDAQVPPHVIDRVRAGDAAEVRFSAFADSPTLVVDGRVLSLSGDALTEQLANGVSTYYLARIEITPDGLASLGNRNMHPGMPAEVLIKTGERSMLTYLLHPLTKRIAAAMKEE
ncbi:MAG: HlyD family type I secretion periplasmic adaptor subunit [Rubrivivax sp.]|nr:HlyD family type I secretion periplasmic adaptor subunit [Rubrivivax sp.]